MAPDLSVIVCTHQPRPEYLSRTLAALRGQTLHAERWELIVIDNASTPPLAPDLSWHPQARLCREEKLGLTWARLRGLQESSTALLVLVDDDNVLDPDYLAETLRLGEVWPMLGVWGGAAIGEFETSPPEWSPKYWRYLAVRDVTEPIWGRFPGIHEGLPFGAGMCVRRPVLQAYADQLAQDPRRTGLDPVGQELLRAGDLDLALTAYDCGFGAGRFPSLRLTHLIPAVRLELGYLLRLAAGAEYSGVLLKHFRGLPLRRESRLDQLLFRLKTLRLSPIDAQFNRTFLQARHRAEQQIATWR